MRKLILSLLLFLIITSSFFTAVSAQEDFIVTIGEDKIFNIYNIYETSPLEQYHTDQGYPDVYEIRSEGQEAYVHIKSGAHQDGHAYAKMGLNINFQDPYEVGPMPVTISISYRYSVELGFNVPPSRTGRWVSSR